MAKLGQGGAAAGRIGGVGGHPRIVAPAAATPREKRRSIFAELDELLVSILDPAPAPPAEAVPRRPKRERAPRQARARNAPGRAARQRGPEAAAKEGGRFLPLSSTATRRRALTGAALCLALALACLGGWVLFYRLLGASETRETAAAPPNLGIVVERIIVAESSGNPDAKNKRSSATGAAQFIDETWLRLIRVHRPDLAKRGEKEVLELRRDPEIAREITRRFTERNAGILSRRGLAVTPGTLYLSHFAGGAGAVALLSAAADANAAAVMASADSSGKATREKIVKANPFLERFTVADIKSWADKKMQPHADCGLAHGRGAARAPC